MKKKDIILIANLRQNGRIPLTQLAKRTGIPPSTAFDRIKTNLNRAIKKFTALLAPEEFGYNAKAYVLLKANKLKKEELTNHLKFHPNVNGLWRINNGWNLMLECIFKNMKEVEDFVDELEKKFEIQNKEINYVIEEIKRETWLSDPNLIEFD